MSKQLHHADPEPVFRAPVQLAVQPKKKDCHENDDASSCQQKQEQYNQQDHQLEPEQQPLQLQKQPSEPHNQTTSPHQQSQQQPHGAVCTNTMASADYNCSHQLINENELEQQPLSVGVWLSVKKWTEMKNAGLFDENIIMKASHLLSEFLPSSSSSSSSTLSSSLESTSLATSSSALLSAASTSSSSSLSPSSSSVIHQSPIKYHQIDMENTSILSQQQDNNDQNNIENGQNCQKRVEKGQITQFQALLHKNSEIMANSIYFQIESSLNEYSSLLKSIELQTEYLQNSYLDDVDGKEEGNDQHLQNLSSKEKKIENEKNLQNLSAEKKKKKKQRCPKLVLIDDFPNVERTLDRCEIYNAMMKYIPVGEGPNCEESIPIENRGLLKTPLKISLPPSVLLYQPLPLTHNKEDQTNVSSSLSSSSSLSPSTLSNLDRFDLSDVISTQNTYKQLELIPENALNPLEVAKYPLFYDKYGDGLDAMWKNIEKNQICTPKPSILCLKSPLSSGSSISHAMVLTHNAVQSRLLQNPEGNEENKEENGQNSTKTNSSSSSSSHNLVTTSQYQPPSILYSLPPGLHLLTHVSPHHKVYKVYVVGESVEIECRDSIDTKGIYQRTLLTYQAQQFKKLCDYAVDMFKKNDKPQNNKNLIQEFRQFSLKLQNEYQIFCKNQEQEEEQKKKEKDEKESQQQAPVALYFNSQYMKMHMYTGSTTNDLLHSSSPSSSTSSSKIDPSPPSTTVSLNNTNNTQSPSQLPYISEECIDSYLQNVLDGSVQPLLSIFPNHLTQKIDQKSLIFNKDILYPSISTLYPSNPTHNDGNGVKEMDDNCPNVVSSSLPSINNCPNAVPSSLPPLTPPHPIKDTIYLSNRKVIPPYLPGKDTFEHARSESVVTSSEAWTRHVAIRKMLKALWKVEDEKGNKEENINNCEKKEENTPVVETKINDENNQQQEDQIPTRLGLIDLHNDTSNDTIAFKTTIISMARLLQDKIGLTLFGFDVVQNFYTGNLTVIDVNYFPTYSGVKDLPTRVAREVLRKYKKECIVEDM